MPDGKKSMKAQQKMYFWIQLFKIPKKILARRIENRPRPSKTGFSKPKFRLSVSVLINFKKFWPKILKKLVIICFWLFYNFFEKFYAYGANLPQKSLCYASKFEKFSPAAPNFYYFLKFWFRFVGNRNFGFSGFYFVSIQPCCTTLLNLQCRYV